MSQNYTYCRGRGCLVFDKCKRYRVPSGEDENIWYFSDEPFTWADQQFHCEMFGGLNQTNIFDMLKDITDGKETKRTDVGGIEETKQGNGEEVKGDSE